MSEIFFSFGSLLPGLPLSVMVRPTEKKGMFVEQMSEIRSLSGRSLPGLLTSVLMIHSLQVGNA